MDGNKDIDNTIMKTFLLWTRALLCQ